MIRKNKELKKVFYSTRQIVRTQFMILYIVKVTFQRDIKFVSISYLIYMENEVKLTDILKAFVQRFHKYLKWNELK